MNPCRSKHQKNQKWRRRNSRWAVKRWASPWLFGWKKGEGCFFFSGPWWDRVWNRPWTWNPPFFTKHLGFCCSKFLAPMAKLVAPFLCCNLFLRSAGHCRDIIVLDEIWGFPQKLLTVVMVAGSPAACRFRELFFRTPSCFVPLLWGRTFKKPSALPPYCWWLQTCTSWLVTVCINQRFTAFYPNRRPACHQF